MKLARHNVFSAPVVDVDAPEDASWIDRYIGIVEFAGIVVWILHQVCWTYYIPIQLIDAHILIWKLLSFLYFMLYSIQSISN